MHRHFKELSDLLLYGHPNLTLVTNRAIVESTTKFTKSTRRFKTYQFVVKLYL